MLKFNQKGAAFLILVFIFAAVIIVGVTLVGKILINTNTKLSKTSSQLAVALQTQYQNPFDKNTGYKNPFSQNKNPFDNLK